MKKTFLVGMMLVIANSAFAGNGQVGSVGGSFAYSYRFSGEYALVNRDGHAIYNGNKTSPESILRNCPENIKIATGVVAGGSSYSACSDKMKMGCFIVSVLDGNNQFLMSLNDSNSQARRTLSESATSSEASISNIEMGPEEFWARKITRVSSTQIKISYRDVLKDQVGGVKVKDFDFQCIYQNAK